MIKPNVYYKVIHYGNDYWRPYNNHWNYNYNWQNSKPIYAPSNNSNNSNNNNNNNQTPVIKPSSNISSPPTPLRPNKRGGNYPPFLIICIDYLIFYTHWLLYV